MAAPVDHSVSSTSSTTSSSTRGASCPQAQSRWRKFAGIVKTPGSLGFNMLSEGVGNFVAPFREGSVWRAPLGAFQIVTGAVGTLVLGIPYVLGNMIEFSVSAKGMIFQPTNLESEEKKENQFSFFDLNAALGQKFLKEINMAGTDLNVSLKERADRILAAIGDQPDMITFQEVFDPGTAEYMSQKLAENGYSVVCNAGRVLGGTVGFNSGLLTAVHKRAGVIQSYDYHRYTVAANEENLCAKGLLTVDVQLHNGERLVIANTHLQAGGSAQTAVRKSQMGEMSEILHSEKVADKHILLAGDMNPYDTGFAEWNEVMGRSIPTDSHQLDPVFADFEESIDLETEKNIFGSGLATKSFAKEGNAVQCAIAEQVDTSWEQFSGNENLEAIRQYVAKAFLARQCLYKSRGMDSFEDFNKQINDGIEEIRAHRAQILGSDYTMTIDDTLQAKITRLLQRRNDLEIAKEAQALKHVCQQEEGEDNLQYVARAIAGLIDGTLDTPSIDGEQAYKSSTFLTKQLEWFGRHFNDRIITKSPEAGACSFTATYQRDFDHSELSDHIPLIAQVVFSDKAGI